MEPLFVVDLFPKLDLKLFELLKSLSGEEWQKPTLSPRWNVHDIALHLLDGNIKTLSMLRDQYYTVNQDDIQSYYDLVRYLNQINNEWVDTLKRVSPNVLIDLLSFTGIQYHHYLKTLDPFSKAAYAVSWAGENQSDNWFHIAREYTEKWHHQQQIRSAVEREDDLYTKEFYYPYLDTSMRALPHHYRNLKAKNFEIIHIMVSGAGGGEWYLQFNQKKWDLIRHPDASIVSTIHIPEELAWRLFSKSLSKKQALAGIDISGDQILGLNILDVTAIMA